MSVCNWPPNLSTGSWMHFVILLPKHSKELYLRSRKGKDDFLCFSGIWGIHLHPQSQMLYLTVHTLSHVHTHAHYCPSFWSPSEKGGKKTRLSLGRKINCKASNMMHLIGIRILKTIQLKRHHNLYNSGDILLMIQEVKGVCE